MSDYTSGGGFHQTRRVPRVEFFFYFTLIVTLAVLPHVLGWTWSALRHLTLPQLSPWARAWKDAQAVTPMIFRG